MHANIFIYTQICTSTNINFNYTILYDLHVNDYSFKKLTHFSNLFHFVTFVIFGKIKSLTKFRIYLLMK